MLDIIKAIIYGIVEGITEWLPISSTGHLILVEKLLPFSNEISESYFDMFEVVIQLGAIMAVVLLFWNKLWPFAFSKEAQKQNTKSPIPWIKWNTFLMWIKIMISCIPAAIIGILFDDVLDRLFYNYVVVSISLIAFGIAFILIENWNKNRHPKITKMSQLTYQAAVWIGVFQVIAAVFPGTSRSGATIIGALLIGVSRTVAAEYTFFLAIPVMFGASLLKILKFGFDFGGLEIACLALSCAVAFLVSAIVLKFLMSYIKKNDFKVFGWYRIVLGIVVLIFFGLIF